MDWTEERLASLRRWPWLVVDVFSGLGDTFLVPAGSFDTPANYVIRVTLLLLPANTSAGAGVPALHFKSQLDVWPHGECWLWDALVPQWLK